MDFGKLVTDFVSRIFSGNADSVISVLALVIMGLVYDRLRLIKKIDLLEQKESEIIEDYYKATITIADAFNSLKVVLTELKSKL